MTVLLFYANSAWTLSSCVSFAHCLERRIYSCLAERSSSKKGLTFHVFSAHLGARFVPQHHNSCVK